MLLSDAIEQFIKGMLLMPGDSAELKRNEIAMRFNCAPSQINYVLSTRFSPERGYIVETRRGSGGCVKILRLDTDRSVWLLDIACRIKQMGNLRESEATDIVFGVFERGYISKREALIMCEALSHKALYASGDICDKLRADILNQMILSLLKEVK